jgi:hypothetical protein
MTAQNATSRLDEINSPAHWWAKAVEARSIAEALSSPGGREHMIAAAESYERLAALLEKMPAIEKGVANAR